MEKISYRKTSEYQLNVDKLSFYPHKDTICIDGAAEKHSVEGLKKFVKLANLEK